MALQNTSNYGSIPSGLPTYFSFGIISHMGETSLYDAMRTQNGTKFDFRFQWLTGGVNTGKDWTTWANGTFLTKYVTESGTHGYIPVLLYYELCQSNGPHPGTDCNTGSNDVQYTGNLKTKSLMKTYFSNWTLLMQKIGAYGKPVVVVAEPDFWGFMQVVAGKQYGTNDPTSIPAEVKASGNPDAVSFPNNVQGFAWALLHIRDKYAPNARLALHVSYWSAGYDIGTSTKTNIDVAAVAQTTADFINKAGIVGNPSNASTWDVLTNDVSWRYLAGKSGTWWDRYNKTFPNFARYLSFMRGVNQDTHRLVIMLQVPVGNQYYDTMNNTTDHYQDNRAEYIFGHIADFVNAGIIAVLFGKNSSPLDLRHDGITNPSPISTYECDKCNTHISHYPDDDGGYLRLTLGAYMKHPIPLP